MSEIREVSRPEGPDKRAADHRGASMHTHAEEPRPGRGTTGPPPHRDRGVPEPGERSGTHLVGRPLDGPTRQEMEGRFGHDFSTVRIRDDDGDKAGLGRHERARTVGEEVTFAAGQYRPALPGGRRLLAHELTHVVQQRRGGAAPVRDGVAANEREAERVADAVTSGAPVPAVLHGTAVGAAFQSDEEGMTPAHAGGAMGELDAAFALGQRGFGIVIGPAGPGGHQLTAPGLDIVAYDPQSDETWVVDNKASGGTGTVRSASAITTNLAKNLRTAIAQIRTLPAFPDQARVVQQLEDALDAVTKGNPLPAKVKVKITGAGGYHSGISRRLRQQGIQWEDLTGAAVRASRRQDVARARIAGVSTGRPVTRSARAGTPAATTGTAAGQLRAPAVSRTAEPPVPGGRPVGQSVGRGGGSNVRAGAAAGGAALVTGIATIFINQWLQEHYAGYRAEGIREFTEEALKKADPKFEEALRRHHVEIKKAQAQGRHVYLHVVVKVRMVDSTDRESGIGIGDVAFGSDIVRVQVVYEGDPEPGRYDPDTWLVGDLARGMFGISSRYSEHRLPISGTNLAVRRRNEVVKEVEAMMADPQRPFEFETLLVRSQHSAPSKELLREYAGHRRELSETSPFVRDRRSTAYWTRMEALADAPLAEVITQAKVALVPLDELRQFAVEQRALEERTGNPDGAARWTAVLHLIDAPLDERLHAERQRSAWRRGPSQADVDAQQENLASLERRKTALETQLSQLAGTDARTQVERDAGEPPHPPWSKMWEVKKQIRAIEEQVKLERRLLQGMGKR